MRHHRDRILATILQQLASGDQAAVARCLDEYGGLVWELASRYLATHPGGSKSDVEDGVQEVFISIWLSAARYDPALGSEPAFVATIAHRRLTDYRRRLTSRKTHESNSESSLRPQASGPTAEEVDRLGIEFKKLPDDERTALWLAIGRGLSHREIAGATDVPVGTVKSRLRRAVLRLQDAWSVVRVTKQETGGRA